MMLSEMLFCYSIAMALIMQVAYNHRGQKYRAQKNDQIETSGSFRIFYLLLRVSYIPLLYLALFHRFLAFTPSSTLVILGLIISFVGAALFIYAKTILGANYSPCYDSYAPNSVTRKGIYRYVRHPIYSSNVLNLIGVACFTGSYVFAASAFILGFYYWRSALREEAVLVRLFPEYSEYQQHSGRFFPKWN